MSCKDCVATRMSARAKRAGDRREGELRPNRRNASAIKTCIDAV